MRFLRYVHSASFLNAFPWRLCASSCVVSNFFRRADASAEAMIRRLPSVLTSSGVSGSILQEIEDQPVDHQRQAISVFRPLLEHTDSVAPMHHQWSHAHAGRLLYRSEPYSARLHCQNDSASRQTIGSPLVGARSPAMREQNVSPFKEV
jgi:hypothetical protein